MIFGPCHYFNLVYVSQISDIAPVLSKEFLDIQAAIECRFTLTRPRDMIQITEELNIKTSLMICQNVEKRNLLLADALQIGGLKNFANDTGRAPALESPFKFFKFSRRQALKTCETSKNTSFYRTLPMTASRNSGSYLEQINHKIRSS